MKLHRTGSALLAVLLLAGAAVERSAAAPDRAAAARYTNPLEHRDLIVEGLRHNFSGDFEAANRVWARLRDVAPEHPAGPVFEVSTLFWFQMFDDENTRWDETILERAGEAIALAQARLDADPDDLQGHFYLGQALMQRGRLKGIRGRYLSAGSDGERARVHLERVIELEPKMVDGRYQVGLYYFYASLLPRIVSRWLGWLWFVPSGDGETGLAYLNEVFERGDLFRDEAGFMLANIYTYYETERLPLALAMVSDLHARYPRNTLIHFELIEVLLESRDFAGAIEQTRRLEATTGGTALDRGRRTMARVWRARAELLSGESGSAWETLIPFEDAEPEEPLWGGAWIHLTRGQILDVRGERERALAEYERVLAFDPPRGSERASEFASRARKEPFRTEAPPSMRAAE